MKQEFTALDKLGFKVENGLCFTINEAKNNAERLYMDEAKKLGAKAVFFRRFYRNDDSDFPYHSEPAVCIFHKFANFFNSQEHKDLHAALWSAGKTEIYVIQIENRIDIINARKPAKKVNSNDIIIDESLKLSSETLVKFNDRKFSAHLFGSGTFWEQSEFKKELDVENSPYIFLLDYLMEVRERLNKSSEIKLSSSTLDKLLILSILIKFLEEIKDDNGRHTLRAIYKKHGIASFAEALEKKLILNIIAELKNEFNGKIFDQFTDVEKNSVQSADLNLVSQFLRANIELDTNQYFLWEQYSFQHLPAEVISGIYENFIQADAQTGKREKGVVYTPIHLVNLLVDEVMPLDKPEHFKNEAFRVLDPACGSGVFLVAAFKRMLQWWTINNSKNEAIQYPDKEVAQRILEANIFGVDIEETAVFVSVFGLTIALLDKLTPKEIWDNLKFKNLSEENIQWSNFSDWAEIAKDKEEEFELVIGNPPFNPSSKGTITKEKAKKLFGKKIPGDKLALKFLEAGALFGKKICMIIPANNILYNNRGTYKKYRKDFFTDNRVHRIFDFTHLRESLFVKKSSKKHKNRKKTGRTPVVALILNNNPSEYQSIEHIIVKRETFSEKKIRFEIGYYDRHLVRWDWATNEKMQFVWKTNLLGGSRLFHLIYRLSLLSSLEKFLFEKEKKNDWMYKIGYITNHKKKKKVPAAFITGKPTIKPKSFSEHGNFEVITETEKSFVEIRKKKLFEPPHVIFKLVLEKTKIPMAFVEEYLCFNSSFVGISAPEEEKEELHKIYDRLFADQGISNLYRIFILSTSSKALVYHETSIVKDDIDNLPYPEETKYLTPSSSEKILINDALNYYRHLGKSINEEKTGGKLFKEAEEPKLKDFGNVFCEILNEIYALKDQSWQMGKITQSPSFTHYQFGFGKNNGLKYSFSKESEEQITHLLNDNISNKGVIHKRIIRYYKHENGYDCVYLIKPNSICYWLKSIALRDADDTFMDLKKDGF